MSQLKWLPVILITALITVPVQAEPVRTFFSLENQLPRWEQYEVGLTFNTFDQERGAQDTTFSETSVYARYGLLDDLAVVLEVPFLQIDPTPGNEESGLGDVELGFQLRAYEDIFGYPYFIPYVHVSFPTGDEDKNLGKGDVAITGGISYGSRINDLIDWVIDVSYEVNSDDDNILMVGHSYIWNVSDEFAILTEAAFVQSESDFVEDEYLIGGGINYNWTPELEMGLLVSVGSEDTESELDLRVSYSF